MSWQDNNALEMSITTGDGVVYTPDYIHARQLQTFNIAEYNFKGVPGTLVKRGEVRGGRHSLEIIFQGDDHLDVSARFRESAKNKNAWTINHPKYGVLVVQPTDLEYQNEVESLTRITGIAVETITDQKIRTKIAPPQKVAADFAVTNTAFAQSYADNVGTPTVSDVQRITNNINTYYNEVSASITDAVDYTSFTNTYNELNALVNTAAYDALAIIGQAQDILTAPVNFSQGALARVLLLGAQLANLYTAITAGSSSGAKRIYENNAGTVIGAMCVASVTNYSYANRNNVVMAITAIVDGYNGYVNNLDTLKSTTGTGVHGYIPDPGPITLLTGVVNYTISALFEIAAQSKQEVTVLLEADSNVIIEAHKYYGLQADDSTIQLFMDTNNITIDELLILPKGRKIKYYV